MKSKIPIRIFSREISFGSKSFVNNDQGGNDTLKSYEVSLKTKFKRSNLSLNNN